MKLLIKPRNDTAREFYSSHGHFHDGDAGLDLYVLEDIAFAPGETRMIRFGISCEPDDGRAYYLFSPSSIAKTPLRMANSIGLIDGGYRGEIMAACDNIRNEPYAAVKGQRLFQLVACAAAISIKPAETPRCRVPCRICRSSGENRRGGGFYHDLHGWFLDLRIL